MACQFWGSYVTEVVLNAPQLTVARFCTGFPHRAERLDNSVDIKVISMRWTFQFCPQARIIRTGELEAAGLQAKTRRPKP